MAGFLGNQPSQVPLTSADIADGTITNDDLAGSIADAKISALSASKLTGQVGVAQGGTGAATHTANNVLIGNGTSAITSVAPSTSGNVLTSNGSAWASTAPAGGGAWEFVSTTNISAGANIDITGLEAGKDYYIIYKNFKPATDQTIPQMRLSHDNGSSFVSSSIYSTEGEGGGYGGAKQFSSTAFFTLGDVAQSTWNALGNASTENSTLFMYFSDPNNASFYSTPDITLLNGDAYGRVVRLDISCRYAAVTAVDAIRLYLSSGNFSAQGVVLIYTRTIS